MSNTRGRGQRIREQTSFTTMQQIGPPEPYVVLAAQLIEAADKLPGSMEDYVAGMRYVLSQVEVAIQAAKELVGDDNPRDTPAPAAPEVPPIGW